MHPVQNTRQKSIARKTMILIAAITLGTVVATNALAAGHGGGSGGHGGGGGFGGGHVGGGFVGGRMAGDQLGGHRGAFLGNPGGGDFRGTRMGGGFHNGDPRFREHFGTGLYGYVPGYGSYGYDDYGYDGLGDYAGDTACFQYRPAYTTAGWQWRQVWVCN